MIMEKIKDKEFVRIDKTEFILLILKMQQDVSMSNYYDELLKVYENNILNDIEKKRYTSTIKIDRTLKNVLCV